MIDHRRLALGMIAFLLPAAAHGTTWVRLAKSDNGIVLYGDPSSIRGLPAAPPRRFFSVRQASFRTRFPKRKDEVVRSALELVSFDCRSVSALNLSFEQYSKANRLVDSHVEPDTAARYAPVFPNTLQDAMFRFTCAAGDTQPPSPLAPDWRFSGVTRGATIEANFVDTKVLYYHDNEIHFWIWTFVGGVQGGADNRKANVFADCATHRFHVVKTMFFRGAALLKTIGAAPEQAAAPGTIYHDAIDSVCGTRPFDGQSVANPEDLARQLFVSERGRSPRN